MQGAYDDVPAETSAAVAIKKTGVNPLMSRCAVWRRVLCSVFLCWAQASRSQPQPPGATSFDAAAAFGARESVTHLKLSPDGKKVAYVIPGAGQGSIVFTREIADARTARQALVADGRPERIAGCDWVSNERLVCTIYGIVKNSYYKLLPFTRVMAVNADGSNLKMLSTKTNDFSRGIQLGGGEVIDWLPDESGTVLMSRVFLPDVHLGTRAGSTKEGLGVDRLDTNTLNTIAVEPPRDTAEEYLSDGRGVVRIMALSSTDNGRDTGITRYMYRQKDSRTWLPLSQTDVSDHSGFMPAAVDAELNVAYGFKKTDGRETLYSIALDGSLHEKLIYARPDVDLDGLITLGRRNRVIGVSYTTDSSIAEYFDPEIRRLATSLSKALPHQPILYIADATPDENTLLIFAGGDQDPGVYYLFDRKTRHLDTFLVARSELEGVKLAAVQPISYPAADGTMVPAYLTLPPGRESAKGLPAVVLPHGGPSARDSWGFDWLSQFLAARGFAVLQPNYRGSSGYGDSWMKKNGFQSWPVAIGDVLSAGKWLVAQGIADPAKLGILGWSYGGYAALQSAVVDPSVFHAVIAIAPVTDLVALKDERWDWSDYYLVSDYIGQGPHVRAGSPIYHADKIKVPVLLFHGALDRNVSISQSQHMASKLSHSNAKVQLVTWDDLDHQLEDSAARTSMLRKIDAFLRESLGL